MLFQQSVEDLVFEGGAVRGVRTRMDLEFHAPSVVLTVGTFLGGCIHVGLQSHEGGRAGDPASVGLARYLRGLGLRVARLKTGTPPRLDGRSVDFDAFEEQPGDHPPPRFCFLDGPDRAAAAGFLPHHAYQRADPRVDSAMRSTARLSTPG